MPSFVARRRLRRRPSVLVAISVGGLVAAVLAALPPTSAATGPGANGEIAFTRHNQIFVRPSTAAGSVTQLTTLGKNYWPRWSPNGTRIAYIHETPNGSRDIWIMGAAGRHKHQLTHFGDVATMSWSPDGRWLAFGHRKPARQQTMWKIRTGADPPPASEFEGYVTETTCVGSETPADAHPILFEKSLDWSPDGNYIVHMSPYVDGCNDHAMLVYNLGTGEDHEINATSAECCGWEMWNYLRWTPDGDFGFASQELDEDTGDYLAPRIVFPYDWQDGRDWPYTLMPGRAGDTGFAPSPNGRLTALVNASSGAPVVYVQRLDGSGRRLLVRNAYQPDWQPLP